MPGLAVRPDLPATGFTPLLPVLTSARTITVIQRGPDPHARTAGLVSELLAARGDDVLLVDAGVARPAVHVEYDVALAPGLSELRRSARPTEEQLKDLPTLRGLHVLSAGEKAEADVPRSDVQSLTEILKTAPQARVTIAASVTSVSDLLEIVGDLDGPTVLDIDASTTKRQLKADVDTLRGLGLDLVAVTISTGSRGDRGQVARQHAR